MEDIAPTRRIITAPFATVVACLPAIGKLMVIGKTDAVTHERIGPVESIAQDGEQVLCIGECHDSRIDGSAVVQIIADTSSIMREQVYPRLDFNGTDGTPVFSIVGFGGLAPFEDALAGLAKEAIEPEPKAERKQRPDVADQDPGRGPLEAAQASQQPITIAFAKNGFEQKWSGVVAKISLGMGFINVMTEDFHLHLPGGSVASWVKADKDGRRVLTALDAQSNPIGLTLSAETAAAFAEPAQAAE